MTATPIPIAPLTPEKGTRRKDMAITFGILASFGVGALTFLGMTATPDARTVANKFKADSAWTTVSDEQKDRFVYKKWTTGTAQTATPQSMEAILKDSGFNDSDCSHSITTGFTCSAHGKGNTGVFLVVDIPTKESKDSHIFMVAGDV